MKVHILIAGWDNDRSIYGCARLGSDKVYVIVPKKRGVKEVNEWVTDRTRKIAEDIKRKYSKLFSVKLVSVVYDNYVESFRAFMKIIRAEQKQGNEVFVNVSAGSHVVAAAGMFAASMAKCRAYYVIPKSYDNWFKNEEKFMSHGGKKIVDIPLLPVSTLSSVEIGILSLIKKRGNISEPDLAKAASGKLFFKSSRSKINYYLKKFEENGFVKNKMKSGKIFTSLTDSGRMVIESLV